MIKLEKADRIPLFNLSDINNNAVDVSNYKGKKLLLSFFRDVHCPYTNIWVDGLKKNQDYFKDKNLQVIGVFNSTSSEIISTNELKSFNFPLIPDESLDLYSKYGIEESKNGAFKSLVRIKPILSMIKHWNFSTKSKSKILPAEFLINEDLSVHQAHYGKDFADHINSKEIIKWIK